MLAPFPTTGGDSLLSAPHRPRKCGPQVLTLQKPILSHWGPGPSRAGGLAVKAAGTAWLPGTCHLYSAARRGLIRVPAHRAAPACGPQIAPPRALARNLCLLGMPPKGLGDPLIAGATRTPGLCLLHAFSTVFMLLTDCCWELWVYKAEKERGWVGTRPKSLGPFQAILLGSWLGKGFIFQYLFSPAMG